MLHGTQALAWWEGAPGAGMSRRSKLVLGLSVVLTAATVAGVHLNQRQDRQRLRDGVIRDIERQNRKKENIRLLGEQIILTEQLEAEREKMLLAKDLKQHDLK